MSICMHDLDYLVLSRNIRNLDEPKEQPPVLRTMPTIEADFEK
jgi:hypothetical protein